MMGSVCSKFSSPYLQIGMPTVRKLTPAVESKGTVHQLILCLVNQLEPIYLSRAVWIKGISLPSAIPSTVGKQPSDMPRCAADMALLHHWLAEGVRDWPKAGHHGNVCSHLPAVPAADR